MPDQPQITYPRSFYWAFGTLGFTMGLYTGWSTSPVVGSLITGTLGLLSGGAFVVLLTRKEGDVAVLSPSRFPGVAISVVILCAACIVGTIIGINVRNGNLADLTVRSSLIDLPATYGSSLPPATVAKLVIVQASLEDIGYERKANNGLIASLATSLEQEVPTHANVDAVSNAAHMAEDLMRVIDENANYFKSVSSTVKWKHVDDLKHTHVDYDRKSAANRKNVHPRYTFVSTNGTKWHSPEILLQIVAQHRFNAEVAQHALDRRHSTRLLVQEHRLNFLLEKTYIGRTLPQGETQARHARRTKNSEVDSFAAARLARSLN